MTKLRVVLARNIKEQRRILGITQAQLAEKVNTSTNYIGQIEQQNKFPSPEMLERIAAALGIDSTQLFKSGLAPFDSREMVNRLSKDITQKVNLAMADIFKQYLG